jgi:hypothetical protein
VGALPAGQGDEDMDVDKDEDEDKDNYEEKVKHNLDLVFGKLEANKPKDDIDRLGEARHPIATLC